MPTQIPCFSQSLHYALFLLIQTQDSLKQIAAADAQRTGCFVATFLIKINMSWVFERKIVETEERPWLGSHKREISESYLPLESVTAECGRSEDDELFLLQ